MLLRRLLSTLASAEVRRDAARTLAVLCAVGFVLTLMLMAVSGAGLRRWVFVLLVWGALIYAPLRILLEAFQSIAPSMRRRLIEQTAARDDRYASRPAIELVVDGLFADGVVMPRIATPVQSAKAKAGAVAVLVTARQDDGAAVARAAQCCLATVEHWVTQLASWATQAPANIQARWADARALAGLAAVTTVLIAAYEDRSGHQFAAAGVIGKAANAYLNACLDYCDEMALEVNAVPWTEPALHLGIDVHLCEQTRAAWKTFSETPAPALDARAAFVQAAFNAS